MSANFGSGFKEQSAAMPDPETMIKQLFLTIAYAAFCNLASSIKTKLKYYSH